MATETNDFASGRWEARWSGAYPSLCSGTWVLLCDGQPVDTRIPFQHEDAGTFGTYGLWGFGGDSGWMEEWEYYDSGLECGEWCDEHREWLRTLAPEGEWADIFAAFQARDWRRGSCGGCV